MHKEETGDPTISQKCIIGYEEWRQETGALISHDQDRVGCVLSRCEALRATITSDSIQQQTLHDQSLANDSTRTDKDIGVGDRSQIKPWRGQNVLSLPIANWFTATGPCCQPSPNVGIGWILRSMSLTRSGAICPMKTGTYANVIWCEDSIVMCVLLFFLLYSPLPSAPPAFHFIFIKSFGLRREYVVESSRRYLLYFIPSVLIVSNQSSSLLYALYNSKALRLQYSIH